MRGGETAQPEQGAAGAAKDIYIYIYIHSMYIYIYIYIYIFMCIYIYIYVYTHNVVFHMCIHVYVSYLPVRRGSACVFRTRHGSARFGRIASASFPSCESCVCEEIGPIMHHGASIRSLHGTHTHAF